MGQEQSNENRKQTNDTNDTTSVINTISEKEEYHDDLNNILNLLNKLIDEYKNQSHFLNSDFCKKIQIAYIPKLGKIPNKVLANMFNDVSSNGTYSIVYVAESDTFKMNFLKKNLKENDLFSEKQVSIKKNGITLEGYDYIPTNRKDKKFEQSAGYTQNQLSRNNKQQQQPRGKPVEFIKNNRQQQQPREKPVEFIKNKKQQQQSREKPVEFIKNNKQQQQPRGKPVEFIKNNKQQQQPRGKPVEFIKNNRQQQQPREKPVEFIKNNRQQQQPREKPVELSRNNKQQQQPRGKPVELSRNNKQPHGKPFEDYEKCKETGDDCMLNKYEVCQKITYNYLYRLNILSAIYHILPRKTTDNQFTGSFYYNRILALKNGNMCIPLNIDRFKQSDDTEKISFLNNILKNVDIDNITCKEFYKTSYTMEELSKLKGDSEFAKKHSKLKHTMESNYKNSLETLYVIILKLKTETVINNSELFDISKLTKQTIDSMYYDAQYNYIKSVLNYIRYNTP
jgi:hypothetical protein